MIEDLKILLTELEIINDAQINAECYQDNDKFRLAQTMFNVLLCKKIIEIKKLLKETEDIENNKED